MAQDPRLFLITPCEKGQKTVASATSEKRDFLRTIGKIGDLEALNDIGLGSVGEGLRTLTKVSNTIRTGRSVVPGREGRSYNSALGRILGTAATDLNKGANAVLDTVGLGGAVDVVGRLNPAVANTAYGSAKQIYDKVKQGNFELTDIPEYITDLTQLEEQARSIFNPKPTSTLRTIEKCGATPYAMALINFAPKYKFLFIVQITFSQSYQALRNIGDDFAFVVKTSSRPNVEYEYEEINMYNFRTHVPKRAKFKPMSMTFYDDNQNNANLFYTAYLRAMSPIVNNGADTIPVELLQDAAMSYENPSATTFGGTQSGGSIPTVRGGASLNPMPSGESSIISQIKLFHIFEYGRLMNVYTFQNPKITALNLDDLTMLESGAGSEMSFDFEYDALYIEPNYAIQDTTTYNIEQLTDQGEPWLAIQPEFSTTTPMNGTANAPTSQVMEGGSLVSDSLTGNPSISQVQSLVSKAFGDTAFGQAAEKLGNAFNTAAGDLKAYAKQKLGGLFG